MRTCDDDDDAIMDADRRAARAEPRARILPATAGAKRKERSDDARPAEEDENETGGGAIVARGVMGSAAAAGAAPATAAVETNERVPAVVAAAVPALAGEAAVGDSGIGGGEERSDEAEATTEVGAADDGIIQEAEEGAGTVQALPPSATSTSQRKRAEKMAATTRDDSDAAAAASPTDGVAADQRHAPAQACARTVPAGAGVKRKEMDDDDAAVAVAAPVPAATPCAAVPVTESVVAATVAVVASAVAAVVAVMEDEEEEEKEEDEEEGAEATPESTTQDDGDAEEVARTPQPVSASGDGTPEAMLPPPVTTPGGSSSTLSVQDSDQASEEQADDDEDDDGSESDGVDPWASEDETSDDYDDAEYRYEEFLYGRDEGDDADDDEDPDIAYENYQERRRKEEKVNAKRAAKYYLKLAHKPRSEKELKFDEKHALYWVHDKQQNREIVSNVAREWRFLVDWLHALKDRMNIEDATRVDAPGAVRIGRGEHDRWINVVTTSHKPGSKEADEEALWSGSTRNWDILGMKEDRRYKMIRESMILQSMMAQVDYVAWFEAFHKVVAIKLPPFVHLDPTNPRDTKLPTRFSISFPAQLELRDYQWRPLMKWLFQPRDWSDRFETAYCTAYQTMIAKGFDMNNLKPVPIKLRYAPEHCGYLRQIAILKAIMHTITKAKKIEERWNKRRQWRASPQLKAPPVLFIESLDLDLREFTVYPSVLNTLEKLVATAGVRIENLILPGRQFDGVYEEHQLRSAWAGLACTVLGIKDFRQGSRARQSTLPGIDRLVVPSFYMYKQYYQPFFMAARDARGVGSVRIEMGGMLQARRHTYDRCIGALIGYAFFSKDSPSSITSLDIDQIAFTTRTMSALERVAQADDPLKQVYHEISGARETAVAMHGREVSLKMGTTLTPCWGASPAKTPAPWAGTVLFDDPRKTTTTVYLAGFGLCDVDRSRLPNKKRRTSTTSLSEAQARSRAGSVQLRELSLWFRSDNDTDDAADNSLLSVTELLPRLATMTANKLESLRLRSELITEETIGPILDNFKKLQSLSLIDAKIEDLSGFAIAYHQGCQISSLDLSGCQIPMVVFKSLLRWLTSDEKVKSTIRRLRFGKDWGSAFHSQSAVTAIASMLKANKELTHLHINIPKEAEMWKAVRAFLGESLAGSSRTVIVEAPPPPPVERDPLIRMMSEEYGEDDPRVIDMIRRRDKRRYQYNY